MSLEKATIGEHCEITSSKRIFFSDYTDHGIPFFRSKEIIEMVQHKDISEALFISQEKYDEIACKFGVPSAGDLLLTSVGTIGIPYIIKESDHFYFKDGNLTWFRNFDTGLLSAFLYYWFLSDKGIGILNNSTIGSSQKALTISNIKKIQIPLFPLNTQAKIVSILSAYDGLIENNQKQIKLLEEAAQRLYKEWFVDLRFPGWENTKIVDGVPEGWHIGLLSELISVNYGKDHKKVPNTGDIPVYGSGGIMRKCNKSLYSGESVLIPRKGSLNNIMYVNESFWTVDTMFFTIPQKAHSAIFTYFFLSGIDMYSFNIGAAVPSMTVKILDNLSLVIPDSSFFEKFDMFVQPYFKKIKLLRKENHSLTTCRNNLLYHLFRSEHT